MRLFLVGWRSGCLLCCRESESPETWPSDAHQTVGRSIISSIDFCRQSSVSVCTCSSKDSALRHMWEGLLSLHPFCFFGTLTIQLHTLAQTHTHLCSHTDMAAAHTHSRIHTPTQTNYNITLQISIHTIFAGSQLSDSLPLTPWMHSTSIAFIPSNPVCICHPSPFRPSPPTSVYSSPSSLLSIILSQLRVSTPIVTPVLFFLPPFLFPSIVLWDSWTVHTGHRSQFNV